MVSSRHYFKKLLPLSLAISLVACDSSDKYIEEGSQLFKAGDYKNAQIAFNKALDIDPKNAESRYEIAETLRNLGDLQSAAAQYQTIINQEPKHVPARIKLGQIYLLASKINDAEKLANEALALNPESTEAAVLLGGVLATQNNSDAAFVKAEAVLTKKPDDVPATLLLASLNARSGQIEKAVSLLQNASEKNPDNIDPRLMLANLYLQTNAADKARETLESIIKTEPKQLEHRKRLAVFLIENKQLDKAEEVLRLAVKDLPDDVQAKLLLVDFLATQRTPEVAVAELIPMIESAEKSADEESYGLRFKLADLQLTQNQADKVEETLKEIVELDKKGTQSVKARNKLALLYVATRRADKARILVKELLDEHPDDADALALRGEFALAENHLPDAISDFRSSLAQQPHNTKVLKLLSTAHQLNNDKVLARENLEKVVEISPKDEIARLDLVNLLLQTGATEQATQQLNTLFKINPNSKNGLQALFKIYLAKKQWEQAQQVAKQLETVYADDAAGFYLSGLAYQAEGKLDKSIAPFTLAMEKQPEAVEPLTQLIKTYLALKQPDKALSKLNEIIGKQANNFVAYNLVGGVYSQLNKLEDAKKAYQKAIDIKPEWASPYRSLALLNRVQNHNVEAIKILTTGIGKNRTALELVTDLADIYHQDGQPQKVIALYEEAYKNNPGSLEALNNLAGYLADYATDNETLNKAAKLAEPLAKTNDPAMLDTVAWLAYKQGNYEKAEQLLLKTTSLDASTPTYNYHLGMVYFIKGETGKAKEYLQKAIDKKEDFNGLSEAKETLKSINSNAGQ